MKRKFSFNLAPVKVPSKSEAQTKPTPELTPSHSHRRHHSKDSVSSLGSPFINRRPLSPKVEHELRAACALILQDFKPSGHVFEGQSKPRRDLESVNRRKEHGIGSSQVQVHRPTGAPAEPRSSHDARKQAHKVDTSAKECPDLPMKANTGRRRVDHTENVSNREHETVTKTKSSLSMDVQRTTANRPEMDLDDATSLRTPLTSSTETHLNNGSTAPTSAALTSGRSSKRASRQFDSAAALADAQAADWMRQELEKRRQQHANQPEPPTPTRAPSRGRSIRSELKEYIFPGSTALSRTQSNESMRSQASSQPKRSSSSHGWRSWGLQRKSSSRSNSRPGTSKGRIETQDQERKPDVDLNRELPPLPSLDSWDQQQKQKRKSQAQGAHIATLMRSQDQQQQDYAAAVRRHHRRSGSDTLAMRYANSTFPQPSAQVARTPSHVQKVQIVAAPKQTSRAGHKPEFSMDFDQLMSAMDSSKNFDDQLRLRVNSHAHQHSTSTAPGSPGMKMSSDQGRLEAPPNFSRKISADVASMHRNNDFAYPNVVQIKPQHDTPREEKGSKLRKVLSGWMLRKDKKENWMDQFEKNGIKGGVMIQDEAALSPIVRY
ncbi:uncharacterized protein BDR25DRAFT_338277 [Lindgomyces ingoldianus]|uniref:Uncharacterized protein n=1 Tax=Lindgomyces ingoldianus TaxID=673940 RepID=A0ACB6RF61_9PLEO|nr:uncharacterized protein BDR25DRAFT_338277 [Lindgomyces ingoldianus]KAF2477398.1 hypothetical protein BDR25DRAFT_338277 [Lindgomyces ingoldianus]